jgi:hypothetical protein
MEIESKLTTIAPTLFFCFQIVTARAKEYKDTRITVPQIKKIISVPQFLKTWQFRLPSKLTEPNIDTDVYFRVRIGFHPVKFPKFLKGGKILSYRDG